MDAIVNVFGVAVKVKHDGSSCLECVQPVAKLDAAVAARYDTVPSAMAPRGWPRMERNLAHQRAVPERSRHSLLEGWDGAGRFDNAK